jgi:predicted phage terminase large subunit-like protein
MISAAHKLYLEHSGRSHRLIEREMHRLGFTTFSRRRFYNSRTRAGRLRLGWIEKFRWKEKLQAEPPASPGGSQSSADNICVDPCLSVAKSSSDSHFPSWLRKVSPSFRWDWPYQKLIYEKLQAITDGRSKRLLIFLPPRHGKSELVTVRYTAWRLKNDPALNVILGSYNQRLANRFSRKVRITWEDAFTTDHSKDASSGNAGGSPAMSATHEKLSVPNLDRSTNSVCENSCQFVAKDSSLCLGGSVVQTSSRKRLNTVAEWETGLGGGVRAVGVGGGITGFGAGLVIIDDPVKSRAEAESRTYREKIWEWYRDDLYTRLEPNAAIILIQTRWHEDDLAGRLLKEMHDGGEHWDVISLPALAEPRNAGGAPAMSAKQGPSSIATNIDPCSSAAENYSLRLCASVVENDPLCREEGEPLCPDRFTREDLLRIKRNLGTYSFSALYQQRPVPPEGGLFKCHWFTRVVDHAPPNLRWSRGYDLALSTKGSADFTASFRCAVDRPTGDLYIADGFRKRIEFPDQRRYILGRILEERSTEHGIEHALHGLAFIQEFRREHRLVSRSFRAVKISGDKFTRALSWANRAEEGKVVLVRGPWVEEFLEEVTSFPNGVHDDQIDAVSIAVEMLDRHRHIARSF